MRVEVMHEGSYISFYPVKRVEYTEHEFLIYETERKCSKFTLNGTIEKIIIEKTI